ncbi:MAG: sulfate ABC transporter substrate-binding protein, partial [Alcanivorax sp.]|nr:sulfate ABC transporter substrate-binding protein [Alcanivorax sp.]
TPIQTLLTEFNYRVHDEAVVKATADQFPPVELLRVEDLLGSWEEVQNAHFGRNGILDQLQARR